MNNRDVVVVSAVRTAIGGFGGSLKDIPPAELAAKVVTEAAKRAGIEARALEHLILGHVIHTETRDMYVSRVAGITAGMDQSSGAMSVNRLCGSGLQAIVSAAQLIYMSDADTVAAGGVENMSRGGYLLPSARWGARMGNAQMMDMMVGALTDPFEGIHMGLTAENVAKRWSIGREEQDAFSVESHQKAVKAIDAGYFKSQILPIELKSKKGVTLFDTDEHVRRDASLESMAKLKPIFKADGSVTAANASGINDGAAAVVLMDAKAAEHKGIKPLARLRAYAHAGVEPAYMGEGPIPAVKGALMRAGLSIQDMDVIESNEAFAAQALAVSKGLELNPAVVNPNGGAVALGHPVGATGAILTVKALYELERIQGRYALVTMCIGGGQGIAAIFERM